MATILDKIVEQTSRDLKKRKKDISFKELESFELFEQAPRSFKDALRSGDEVSIIAEIKKASPSKGLIRKDFDPVAIARQYQEGGAAALSVLTDRPAFQGELEYLKNASKEVNIPVLRKDFIVDPYQIKEAKAYGADAVLLIATITEGNQLDELLHACSDFKVQALVECYSQKDLKNVTFQQVSILGANNRDLHKFEVDLHRGIDLLQQAPEDTVLVSESGLQTPDDIIILFDNDIDAALIGEHFMRQPNPSEAVKKLIIETQRLQSKE